jgi:DNA-binding MarR family transcriptional regulator
MSRKSKSDPGDEPFLNVLRPMVEAYFAVLRRSDRHVRSLGLTPSQFDVIATLGDTQGMSCRELSETTLVTKGTLTGVLDRLEAKGLTERVPSKNDRRSTIIRLTEQGDRLFRKVFPAQIKFLKPYFDRALTASQMKELSGMLLSLKGSFEKE